MFLAKEFYRKFLQKCVFCKAKIAETRGMCNKCYKVKYNITGKCLVCMKSIPENKIQCVKCTFDESNIAVINGCLYKEDLAKKIVNIKNNYQFFWLQPFCNILYENIQEVYSKAIIQKAQAVIYVPLHKNTLMRRGFNQSYLIGKIISKKLNIPLIEGAVIKTQKTKPQKDLNRKDRLKNLKSCFKLNKPIQHQEIAIIDDIYTTGATIQAIASILTDKNIQAWCLARG